MVVTSDGPVCGERERPKGVQTEAECSGIQVVASGIAIHGIRRARADEVVIDEPRSVPVLGIQS